MINFRLSVFLLAVFAATNLQASPRHGALFNPSEDIPGDVSTVLARALKDDKLALIVLGANWCHDSRALAARLTEPPLQEFIESQFVSILVDVGYYQQGQSVMQRFGKPIYYATPTVLVIDPRRETLIAHPDQHQWGAAASISMDDSLTYFREIILQWQGNHSGLFDAHGKTPVELELLNQFEAEQAARVARGYEVVGPLLAALDQSGNKPATFDELWRELADFRNGVSRDIRMHRQSLLRGEKPRDSLSKLAKKYPRLPWEP